MSFFCCLYLKAQKGGKGERGRQGGLKLKTESAKRAKLSIGWRQPARHCLLGLWGVVALFAFCL